MILFCPIKFHYPKNRKFEDKKIKPFCQINHEKTKKYDVIIIGGGHSGCEAALAASKRGCKTLMITLNLDKIGWQPCNPSIGGPAKSTLVHEIDAMGGLMGKIADRTFLHKRILNVSKGPAVWSLRAQTDKREYSEEIKKILDFNSNLTVVEGMVTEIFLNSKNQVEGLGTYFGGFFECKSIVLTTGTFLGGTIWVGSKKISAGRSGEMASFGLTKFMRKMNFKTGRLKTGTPPRIDSRTFDPRVVDLQPSEDSGVTFSFDKNERNIGNTMNCYITHTTKKTISILRENLHLSPKYGGFMKSTGPRYCPSIEDKIVRFTEKLDHQIFLEPEGQNINEIYVQGLSTGLPEKIQLEILKSVKGLEECSMVRPAYSVDYDYIFATQLGKNLMSKIEGLFFAGQICGTTGYEEAASQGLMAGINASLFAERKKPLNLSREGSFIGTMIDDLCRNHISEPYRVLTSRSEFRLLLRPDNADLRISPIGRKYGLISNRRWEALKSKFKALEATSRVISGTYFTPNSRIYPFLGKINTLNSKNGKKISEYFNSNELNYETLVELGFFDNYLNKNEILQLEVEYKYLNYITRQESQLKDLEKMMDIKISTNINYMNIFQISKESREKLSKIRPLTLKDASKVPGISLSDIQSLLIFLLK